VERRPRLKVGMIAPYTDMYEGMPPDFRQEKDAFCREVAAFLGEHADVVYPGLVASPEEGAAAGTALRQAGVDVVVVVYLMAVPIEITWSAVSEAAAPVLIWNAIATPTIPATYDMVELVRHSSNVGSMGLANLLRRRGLPFEIVTGYYRASTVRERVATFLRAADATRRLRQSRLGIVGGTRAGMVDLQLDRGALRLELGPRCIDIEDAELFDAFRAAPSSEVAGRLQRLREEFRIDPRLSSGELERSARLVVALETLVQRHRLDGGTVNCHTSAFQRGQEIGIVACLATSLLTTAGYPFMCLGNLPNAIGMFLLKHLSGVSHWVECQTTDWERGLMLLDNGGEGDLGFRNPAAPSWLRPNMFYTGTHGKGAALEFDFQPGPGTLVGFTQSPEARGGWRLVVAPGEVLGERFPALEQANTLFRFKSGDASRVFDEFCRLGPVHHNALGAGDQSEAFRYVGQLLGIEVVVV